MLNVKISGEGREGGWTSEKQQVNGVQSQNIFTCYAVNKGLISNKPELVIVGKNDKKVFVSFVNFTFFSAAPNASIQKQWHQLLTLE